MAEGRPCGAIPWAGLAGADTDGRRTGAADGLATSGSPGRSGDAGAERASMPAPAGKGSGDAVLPSGRWHCKQCQRTPSPSSPSLPSPHKEFESLLLTDAAMPVVPPASSATGEPKLMERGAGLASSLPPSSAAFPAGGGGEALTKSCNLPSPGRAAALEPTVAPGGCSLRCRPSSTRACCRRCSCSRLATHSSACDASTCSLDLHRSSSSRVVLCALPPSVAPVPSGTRRQRACSLVGSTHVCQLTSSRGCDCSTCRQPAFEQGGCQGLAGAPKHKWRWRLTAPPAAPLPCLFGRAAIGRLGPSLSLCTPPALRRGETRQRGSGWANRPEKVACRQPTPGPRPCKLLPIRLVLPCCCDGLGEGFTA